MRQIADEANRISHRDFAMFGQKNLAHGGIKRRKKLIGDVHLGLGQCIEHRTFTGIGIANKRYL